MLFVSETYTLTTTEEEGVGDHLPTPVMAATAMETDSENVAYTEVNYENEAWVIHLAIQSTHKTYSMLHHTPDLRNFRHPDLISTSHRGQK